MKAVKKRIMTRRRRKRRVRGKISGTADRPRLSVFRSSKNIYAQIIDDGRGATLVSASTREKASAGEAGNGGNREAAGKVGASLAAKALDAGITKVAFDRSGYKYHGRVKALAEAVRKAGVKF